MPRKKMIMHIATRPCQAYVGDRLVTFMADETQAFPADFEHTWLKPIDKVEIDFSTASQELLEAADWNKAELVEFCNENYGVSIARKKTRESLVEAFLDARERAFVMQAQGQ